jgi:hypothetical protein
MEGLLVLIEVNELDTPIVAKLVHDEPSIIL